MDAKQGTGNHHGNIWATNTRFRYGPKTRRSTQVLAEEDWHGSACSSVAVMQKYDVYILSKQHVGESRKGTDYVVDLGNAVTDRC